MRSRGRACGSPMASRRSEAYGMWSFALAIARLFQCFSREPFKLAHLRCGSKALAGKAIKAMERQRQALPSEALEAGWGIASEAMLLLGKYGTESLQWAKAHQDEKIKWEKLSLPARLSCRAGTTCGKGYRKH